MAYLEMRGITKRFPGVVANDHVDFSVEEGEIHALVGENGAGKTTLMRILYGMESPDEGVISLGGRVVHIPTPQVAIRLGIGMVHQHFQLIPSLTALENIVLNREPRRGLLLDRRRARQDLEALIGRLGLRVELSARVADLSVGEQQRVEILKLLYRDARLIILDEPTSVLTPQETHALFAMLKRLKEEGRTLIFISHKLSEVMEIADRVTVLRRGKVVGVRSITSTNERELARMMVGEVATVTKPTGRASEKAPPTLILQGIELMDASGRVVLKDLSFEVHRGEILGVAGVEGNGQQELIELLVGLRFPHKGRIWLDGKDITFMSVRERRKQGLAVIPPDRLREGLSLPSPVWANLVATRYHLPPFSRWGVLDRAALRTHAVRLIREFEVMVPDVEAPASTLSGGNLQRLIIAREVSTFPRLLIAAHPTRGLDMRATQSIRRLLLDLAGQGVAVLLVSTDMDELFALADRLLVLYRGEIAGALPVSQADPESIGLLMAGHGLDRRS
ncbi:MAG: ABC transporter ATP-binding protein [Anaerolineae bacterium]|nr:ABC transporter ATP-binding protein [Anaerolineae bacterium]